MARCAFALRYFPGLMNWPARRESAPAALPTRSAHRIIFAGKR
ncbi:phosphoheptose isomerase [Burkholderia pseudomallei]|uniref:Phosphoheptose isomerase n=3 Tax=pseudomallei group TaxID=111527 RepID=A0AAX1X7T1_BURML|nr:hypothetical protein BMA2900 [Burkholderia mallei ATCC 23344]ARK49234.1 phosphoheptose isomerase [Burkholderia pseudomallei]EBA47370.1 phosphoheptose isomerase [Burkholderia pseudomallei 305]EXI99653.1 phosphoheptose isomerase [Burkholderia pseudomallei MSHR6137]PNW99455.1 phosphoheptose isomerase [Burkholderia sp. 136(2017)]PNX12403.1 phosphoheptose isomerase [Burkholderia sp. 129]PNX26751.1 phosphoheptose isomerase [Burkholderia sp. 117]PNX35477.1 phosphoheptose isomerase [Burkholderia 